MKRALAGGATLIVALALLTACTTGPDAEAVAAAQSYRKALTGWSEKVTAAVGNAKTWTQAEIDAAGDEEMPYEEQGMGDVLDGMPVLKEFDADRVANTPEYRRTAAVAAEVTAAATELKGLEPERVKELRQAGADAYWVVADLYYNTLGGPATARKKALSDAIDYIGEDPQKYHDLLRAADLSFAEERGTLLGDAVEQMRGKGKTSSEPIIPDSPLGASTGAFIIAWFDEEQAFQKDAAKLLTASKAVGAPFRDFWGFANVNTVFRAPVEAAAKLRPALAEVIAHQAETLRGASSAPPPATPSPGATGAPSVSPSRVGDVYRQLLVDGYIPYGDPAQSDGRVADRLWMLWRVRELEKTPDAAYDVARAALVEELGRGAKEGEAKDFRPGYNRMLLAFDGYVDAFDPGLNPGENELMLAAMKEMFTISRKLADYPLMPEVAADYGRVLGQLKTVNEWVEKALKTAGDDPYEQYSAVREMYYAYKDTVTESLKPSAKFLDDDAKFSARLAELIRGTAPEKAKESPSPTPTKKK